MNADDVRRLIRHAAALAEVQKDLMRMVADQMGDTATPADEPTAEPQADGVRRTRRMGGNS